ncbi:hypothetical protein J8J14_11785 [Roseomonas sp. SSH11]|uniref:SCP domain-containing protein n=1 Tax=Pararoseomonas baculiformis TaxID=2820812 RepID=A0ABS4AEN6_9PROT|nr:CAP domain-containing protein [Pararoseomonas baculiformis]MBP0445458.1 hypothetical protein [Pararoseomonas baculiformis]
MPRWLVSLGWVPLLMGCAVPGPTPEQAASILSLHNAERACLGVPPLRWDAGMAEEAGQWALSLARSGRLVHAPGRADGENIWIGTAGAYTVERMVGGWLAEREAFRRAGRREEDFGAVGHYTQMVWRDSTTLGCGLAQARGRAALVCRYRPAGNLPGRRPY